MNEPIKVKLLGEHAVTLPDFAAREELLVAYGESQKRKGVALLRAYAAFLGLCTRLGRRAGADYGQHRFDALSYGGQVYGWLREQGLSTSEIAAAAVPLVEVVSEATFPRESEIAAQEKNSGGDTGTSTVSPSP